MLVTVRLSEQRELRDAAEAAGEPLLCSLPLLLPERGALSSLTIPDAGLLGGPPLAEEPETRLRGDDTPHLEGPWSEVADPLDRRATAAALPVVPLAPLPPV